MNETNCKQIEQLNSLVEDLRFKSDSKSVQVVNLKEELAKIQDEKSSLIVKEEEMKAVIDDLTCQMNDAKTKYEKSCESLQKQVEEFQKKIVCHEEERCSWHNQEDLMKEELLR